MLRLALFAVFAVQALAAGVGAEARATAWLKAHNSDPDMGDLADFAKSDPNGYALVKALMLKKSLGLLDPRKPTASFAAPNTHESDDDKPVGAAAFGQFAAPGELEKHVHPASMVAEVSNTEEDVSMPVSHSNARGFAWKPNQNDDDMVASVLGQAAQLTGRPSPGSLLSQSRDTGGAVSHLTADEMMMNTAQEEASGIPTFVVPSSAAAAPQPEAVVAQEAPSRSETTSGSFGMPALNWGAAPKAPSIDADHAAVAPMVTPVLHLVPVEGVPSEQAPALAPVKHQSASVDNSYLSGIDFGAKAKHDVAAPVVHAPVVQASSTSDNPYLNGLDFGSKLSAPASKKAESSAPLDFNAEIAKISAPAAPKAEASLSSQSQKVRKGSSDYLADIGFSAILAPGGDGAANGDLRLFKFGDEAPVAAPFAPPSLRKSASMIKETAVSEKDFVSSDHVLGQWLGHTEDSDDSSSSKTSEEVQSSQDSNPYMNDLN